MSGSSLSSSLQRCSANGVDFAYLEAGTPDGPLALCLHGFPDHALTFEALLGDLAAAGFHAVAPWMRGYAPTAVPPDGRYQTGALALDALALTDALAGDGEAVLVGHDWGTACAYPACSHRPERFSRLVAMAVPHRLAMAGRVFQSPAQLKRWWYMFFFQHPTAEMAVEANDFALIDSLWRDWSPGFTPPPGYLRALKDTLASPGGLSAALGYYRHSWNPALHDASLADVEAAAAAAVPVPTLYLHGADDGCVGPELVVPEEWPVLFPKGIEVEVVAGAGHFLHLERPEVVNRRIVEFLTRA
jgi:pimeloyl-ACP methyl ester carboxylesterase